MAVALVLSPWPAATATATREHAVEWLGSALQYGKGALHVIPPSEETVNNLGQMASDRVERYAPGAPQSTKNEAVLRFASYLWQFHSETLRKEVIGPREVEYVTNHASAFRNSGAAMLLTAWRVRRAGAIG